MISLLPTILLIGMGVGLCWCVLADPIEEYGESVVVRMASCGIYALVITVLIIRLKEGM